MSGMKVFAQKMTRWFLKEGIVDPERAEWCVYVIESRVFTLISLSLVILWHYHEVSEHGNGGNFRFTA